MNENASKVADIFTRFLIGDRESASQLPPPVEVVA